MHLVIQGSHLWVTVYITKDRLVTQVHQDQGVIQEFMALQEQQEEQEHVDLQVIKEAEDHKDLLD